MADRGRTAAGQPVTPDGRYFVVRGRLWRMSDPSLSAAERTRLVATLMDGRRAVAAAARARDPAAEAAARAAIDTAKRGLGERGAPWWPDGAPDYNRRMARNSPYAEWFAARAAGGSAPAAARCTPMPDPPAARRAAPAPPPEPEHPR